MVDKWRAFHRGEARRPTEQIPREWREPKPGPWWWITELWEELSSTRNEGTGFETPPLAIRHHLVECRGEACSPDLLRFLHRAMRFIDHGVIVQRNKYFEQMRERSESRRKTPVSRNTEKLERKATRQIDKTGVFIAPTCSGKPSLS